jgi:hypothetical protein
VSLRAMPICLQPPAAEATWTGRFRISAVAWTGRKARA